MIKVEEMNVYNLDGAFRGLRNPMNSWDKSDSRWTYEFRLEKKFMLGPNDIDLAQRMIKAGDSDAKFLRQIFVTIDITAPLYWWKEMDTYKVATVANSCSTMHKIHAKEFTKDDFSYEHLFDGTIFNCDNFENDMEYYENSTTCLEYVINVLNYNRKKYLETKDKRYWWQMIQLLPSSYNQKRTWTANYAVIRNIIKQRKNHKLDEWHEFIEAFHDLPYAEELLFY